MDNDLDRAEQYLTKAWSSAHQIGDDVDENLKTCLIYLSSGLLNLASSQAKEKRESEQQAVHNVSNNGSPIRTRSGVGIGFSDR